MLAFDVTSAPAIADGIATTINAYDNQIYAWGMGRSKTTISALRSDNNTAPITITGSVTDISAGAQQQSVAANFPNGLPCVSDASMSQFMEAVYEQQPMPHSMTGVPLTLSVLDSNGNYRTIGMTTTNAQGSYGFTWKPDISGNYTVYATFAGTGHTRIYSLNILLRKLTSSNSSTISNATYRCSHTNHTTVRLRSGNHSDNHNGAVLAMLTLRNDHNAKSKKKTKYYPFFFCSSRSF